VPTRSGKEPKYMTWTGTKTIDLGCWAILEVFVTRGAIFLLKTGTLNPQI